MLAEVCNECWKRLCKSRTVSQFLEVMLMFLEVIIEFLEVMQCSWRLCSCSWRLYNVPGGYTMFLEVIQTRVGIELLGQLKKARCRGGSKAASGGPAAGGEASAGEAGFRPRVACQGI